MMKKITIAIFSFSLVVTSLLAQKVLAQETSGAKLNFEVNRVAGVFEKVPEKLNLLFKFNKVNKANYLEYLTEKRLAEVSYVIKAKDFNSIEATASRYSTYLGNLINFVIANKIASKKGELLLMFARHAEILTELQKNFDYDSGWWLATQHPINVTKIFSDKINSL